ncbi:hypothetical protein MNBD_UNCLBAC01-1914 [hydrothermal vent metagenome]|uniref:Uncharacterized protein n=1 Tax=hydrothermal vent metagenome TaxID=652676 RepID=A0A3B1DFP9_9ZZZZ
MYTINEPMMALILRFVGRSQGITFYNDEFIQKQLKTIQKYIQNFPPEEQEERAMGWIEEYASKYRTQWEKETIHKEFFNCQCSDCPLLKESSAKHCEIHEHWLQLLNQYTSGEINSKKYVKNSLNLLTQNKENLKVKLNKI